MVDFDVTKKQCLKQQIRRIFEQLSKEKKASRHTQGFVKLDEALLAIKHSLRCEYWKHKAFIDNAIVEVCVEQKRRGNKFFKRHRDKCKLGNVRKKTKKQSYGENKFSSIRPLRTVEEFLPIVLGAPARLPCPNGIQGENVWQTPGMKYSESKKTQIEMENDIKHGNQHGGRRKSGVGRGNHRSKVKARPVQLAKRKAVNLDEMNSTSISTKKKRRWIDSCNRNPSSLVYTWDGQMLDYSSEKASTKNLGFIDLVSDDELEASQQCCYSDELLTGQTGRTSHQGNFNQSQIETTSFVDPSFINPEPVVELQEASAVDRNSKPKFNVITYSAQTTSPQCDKENFNNTMVKTEVVPNTSHLNSILQPFGERVRPSSKEALLGRPKLHADSSTLNSKPCNVKPEKVKTMFAGVNESSSECGQERWRRANELYKQGLMHYKKSQMLVLAAQKLAFPDFLLL
jgi:hypothetical protein